MLISDLFESAPNYDLQGKYDEFNRLYFNGELPRIPLSFKPLKTVGGMVKAKVSRSDPEHPTLVRLGKPKYRKSVLDRDSLQLVLSTAYARAPEDIDAILLHEMIHVWELAVAGDLDGNHGKTFLDKLKEVRAASGIDVPITDSTKGLELVNAAVSSVGVILRPISGGRYAFLMMSTQAIQRALPDIKELAQDKVEVYIVDSPLWIEKSQRMPLQRSFSKDRRQVNKAGQIETVKGYNFNLKWYMADDAAITDLKANGKLLWSKTQISEQKDTEALVTARRMAQTYANHSYTASERATDHAFQYDRDDPRHKYWLEVLEHLKHLSEATYRVQFKRNGQVLAGDAWVGEAVDERDARRKAMKFAKENIGADGVKIAWADKIDDPLTEAKIFKFYRNKKRHCSERSA